MTIETDIVGQKNQSESVPLKERGWGFSVPTCVIDSQSAPALIGVPAEQAYMRAFLMADKKDLVVTDFPLNQCYVGSYLGEVLGFELPQFMITAGRTYSTVTRNIMADDLTQEKIKGWALMNPGCQIQFFNVTTDERELSEALGIKASCGDFEATMEIGSKPGFRRICEELGLPMPEGYICQNFEETFEALGKILGGGKEAIIKAENGTGGNDLQSNVSLSREEEESQGIDLETYAREKLAFFGDLLGNYWVVEERVPGGDGSVHVQIFDQNLSTVPTIFGAEVVLDSYVGGFWPLGSESSGGAELCLDVRQLLVPKLQQIGAFGFHCFDFKGDKFLEDNARLGALDFIDHFVKRIASYHFPGQPYCWYHSHVSVGSLSSFEEVFVILKDYLDPRKAKDGMFLAISNQEVLPFGRSLDLTGVCFGQQVSVEKARAIYEIGKALIKGENEIN